VRKNNFSRKFPEGKHGQGYIKYVDNVEDALRGANACFIFTEWGDIKAIKPQVYKDLMRTPLVYDGRNIYNVEEMIETGVEYYSIGRPYVETPKEVTAAIAEVATTVI